MKDSTLDFLKALVQPTEGGENTILGIQAVAINSLNAVPLSKKWAHLVGLGLPDLLQHITTRDDAGNIAIRIISIDYNDAVSTKIISQMESLEGVVSNCLCEDNLGRPCLVLSLTSE